MKRGNFMLTGKEVINVNVEQIMPNRYQPRDNVDQKKLESLASSIRKHGMIQPIILRQVGNMYEIVVGGRRYEASLLAGFRQVPAIIVNMDDKEMAELTLTENMQRQELSPIEEAKSYRKLQEENNLNIADISKQVGKDESIINNKLKLLSLAPEVQNALLNNLISEGHAKILLKIEDKDKQVEILNKIIKERLPVKDTNTYVSNLNLIDQNIENYPESEIPHNTDTVRLSDLNNENLSIKSALNDLELVDTNSTLFNDNDQIIKEKKEETNMDMNSLNQAAQNNVPNQPQDQIMNQNMNMNANMNASNDSRFFPSFDEAPANMNVPNNMQSPNQEMPNFNQNFMTNTSPTPPTPEPNPIPNFGLNMAPPTPQVNNGFNPNTAPINEQPSNMPSTVPTFDNNIGPVNNFGTNQQEQYNQAPINNGQIDPLSNTMNPMGANTMTSPTENPIPDFRVEPSTPAMPNINHPTPEPNIPVETPSLVDITPAINNTRTFITTLESMGFKVLTEESDNSTEYIITIKIQK